MSSASSILASSFRSRSPNTARPARRRAKPSDAEAWVREELTIDDGKRSVRGHLVPRQATFAL